MKLTNLFFKCIRLLVVLKLCSATLPNLGDRCHSSEDEKQGVCKLLNDCPTATNLFRTHDILPEACNPHNKNVVVCCPSPPRTVLMSKSLEKCNEYRRSVSCGIQLVTGNRLRSISQFPHIGFIIYKKECDILYPGYTGSLVSSRYVVTNAAAVNKTGEVAIKVRLGAIDTFRWTEHTPVDYDIDHWIIHPNYRSGSLYNDIALIKLLQKVEFSSYIRPICLPDTDIQANDVYRFYYMYHEIATYERPLVSYQRRFVPNEICNITYKGYQLTNGINDNFICTTPRELLDSHYSYIVEGSPIMVQHPRAECSNVLLGVSVKGLKSRIADAATKIYNYSEWIEGIIWAPGEDD